MQRLIRKRKPDTNDAPVVYFATIEDTFDIIKRAHVATGRGGGDKMYKFPNSRYAIITVESLRLFKEMCIQCQEIRKRPMTKGIVVQPIPSK